MAFDAEVFMRIGLRVSPSWPGARPKAGYVVADYVRADRQATCNGAGHTFCYSFAPAL